MSANSKTAFRIKDVRVYTIKPSAKAGTYFKPGDSTHWLVDTLISNPMSGYPKYKEKRSSWGIGVLGALVVEIETAKAAVELPCPFAGTVAARSARNIALSGSLRASFMHSV